MIKGTDSVLRPENPTFLSQVCIFSLFFFNEIDVILPNDLKKLILEIIKQLTLRNSWSRKITRFGSSNFALSCGGFHNFLLFDRTLYSCGYNFFSQLGKPPSITENTNSFEQVSHSIDSPIVDVICGFHFTCVIDEEGSLYCCGDNNMNQLGQFNRENHCQLTKVSNISDCVTVACGSEHVFALTSDGSLFCRGSNYSTQLGLGKAFSNVNSVSSFTRVNISKIVQVACGRKFTIALDEEGKVYACGSNSKGQLGLGDKDSRDEFTITAENVRARAISAKCGSRFSFILTLSGDVFSCGANSYGQLGLKHFQSSVTQFSQVEISNIVAIACGEDHTLALNNEGSLFSCGSATYYQLGFDTGLSKKINEFTKITLSAKIVHIKCGDIHNFIVDDEGNLMSCGFAKQGIFRYNFFLFFPFFSFSMHYSLFS